MSNNYVPDEGIWKCTECGHGERRMKKGDGFVLGEMFCCESCADIVYEKQRALNVELANLYPIHKMKQNVGQIIINRTF